MESLKSEKPSVCIIGAGNVATHLANALASHTHILQIASCHKASSQRLAESIGGCCQGIENLSKLSPHAHFYIIAVHDDAVADVIDSTKDFPGIWAHTSGSIDAEVFKGKKTNYGVFYPLQTFSRDIPVDISHVPFFIEGNSPQSQKKLADLAGLISQKVEYSDSSRRTSLHLAAVFACNFANLMWLEANRLLQTENLNVKFLFPLIEATLTKLSSLTPLQAMTGPARRGDMDIIHKHEQMLPQEWRDVYKLLSTKILEIYHPELTEPCRHE